MSFLWSLPVFRLVATDRCRVAAPWFDWAQRSDGTAKLRRLAIVLERSKLKRVTAFEQMLAALAYLPLSLVAILSGLRQWGKSLRTVYGFPRGSQFIQLAIYAWRLGMCPRMYYHLRLHRYSWKHLGRHFIDQPELHHLQRHLAPADINMLEDKLRFAERAEREGLPVVPILALVRDGHLQAANGTRQIALPRQNLFVKPTASYSSDGIMGFRYDPRSHRYTDERGGWSEFALRHYLETKSKERTLIVQRWMENHPDLQGFSTGALCNFRIVTGRYPNGLVTPVMAAFRFPWRSQLSCAEPGVTLCASVDLERGIMRAAEAKDPAIGRLRLHPTSGAVIEGFVVKQWDELLATSLKAHMQWPEFPFIGWDLALTNEGIFILEGSCLWGGTLAQMSGSAPLGLTRFPEIYLAHLAARGATLS